MFLHDQKVNNDQYHVNIFADVSAGYVHGHHSEWYKILKEFIKFSFYRLEGLMMLKMWLIFDGLMSVSSHESHEDCQFVYVFITEEIMPLSHEVSLPRECLDHMIRVDELSFSGVFILFEVWLKHAPYQTVLIKELLHPYDLVYSSVKLWLVGWIYPFDDVQEVQNHKHLRLKVCAFILCQNCLFFCIRKSIDQEFLRDWFLPVIVFVPLALFEHFFNSLTLRSYCITHLNNSYNFIQIDDFVWIRDHHFFYFLKDDCIAGLRSFMLAIQKLEVVLNCFVLQRWLDLGLLFRLFKRIFSLYVSF